MSTSEVWMGSGLTMTMAPEAKLFLGYMPYGPTLGRENTNKEHLIKYSLGYALDGTSVVIDDAHGEGSNAVKHFTDYYHLVPDLYTGCTAEFYTKNASGDSYALEFTAMVAGNDADAIYFAGNLNDFPSLFADIDGAVSASRQRGYICLQQHGAVVPAPISLETVAAVASFTTGIEEVTATSGTDLTKLAVDELVYDTANGVNVGKVWGYSANNTALSSRDAHDGNSTDDTVHFLSDALGTVSGASSATNSIGTVVMPTSMTGILTAGDFISGDLNTRTNAAVIGIVIELSSDGTTVTFAQAGSQSFGAGHELYWGRPASNALAAGLTSIARVSARILSDNWLGLVDSATPSTPDVMTEQKMMAIGGTRNVTYQYKGMETPAGATLDVTLNHGTWLHYALGSTALTFPSVTGGYLTDPFDIGSPTSEHKTLVATNGSTAAVAGNSSGPFFHRVLKGSNSICPPLLPGTAAKEITEPTVGTDGLMDDGFTYTFTERNDNTLPSFAFELVAEKGSNVDSIPMVDRGTTARQDATTFDTKDNVYAEIHPGATMGSLTLTASAESAVTANMSFNVKTVFDCPTGYVGRAYDATNNITKGSNLPRVLNNFGQNTGAATASKQEFLTPYYFSDGTISLFGSEFMRVTTFDLAIENTLIDKRFIGQHNKKIQSALPGQRTYTINMTAQLTDRRLFAELRNEDSFRSAMSNANIQLLLTKATGENIKLQFDDYMISVASFPRPSEDRGPLEVSFTIMPIRKGTEISTKTSWVLQG